ncbi:MAG: hypothetical protein AAFV43_16495 [Planctomycetota bacterium]
MGSHDDWQSLGLRYLGQSFESWPPLLQLADDGVGQPAGRRRRRDTIDTLSHDTHAVFRVTLDAGKQRLLTRFLDGDRHALCGAIYVRREHLPGPAPSAISVE